MELKSVKKYNKNKYPTDEEINNNKELLFKPLDKWKKVGITSMVLTILLGSEKLVNAMDYIYTNKAIVEGPVEQIDSLSFDWLTNMFIIQCQGKYGLEWNDEEIKDFVLMFKENVGVLNDETKTMFLKPLFSHEVKILKNQYSGEELEYETKNMAVLVLENIDKGLAIRLISNMEEEFAVEILNETSPEFRNEMKKYIHVKTPKEKVIEFVKSLKIPDNNFSFSKDNLRKANAESFFEMCYESDFLYWLMIQGII